MFQNTDQKLGNIQEHTKKIISYPFTNINTIDEVITSCVCSTEDIDKVNNVLKISFSAKEIPAYLILQGWYSTCVTTTVKYTSTDAPTVQKTQVLTFSVTVVK